MTPEEVIAYILGSDAEWDEMLANIAQEYLTRRMQAGASGAAAQYDLSFSFDLENPLVREWLQDYTGLMAQRVNDTIREGIRGALLDGMAEGDNARQIENRILEVLGAERDADTGKLVADDKLKYRAEMIERTEYARAENAGRDWQLKDAGASRVVWRANADACEFCAEIDGMEIAVGESFFKRGDVLELSQLEGDTGVQRMSLNYSDTDFPPLHPNCRCTAEYDFD